VRGGWGRDSARKLGVCGGRERLSMGAKDGGRPKRKKNRGEIIGKYSAMSKKLKANKKEETPLTFGLVRARLFRDRTKLWEPGQGSTEEQ